MLDGHLFLVCRGVCVVVAVVVVRRRSLARAPLGYETRSVRICTGFGFGMRLFLLFVPVWFAFYPSLVVLSETLKKKVVVVVPSVARGPSFCGGGNFRDRAAQRGCLSLTTRGLCWSPIKMLCCFMRSPYIFDVTVKAVKRGFSPFFRLSKFEFDIASLRLLFLLSFGGNYNSS